MKLLCAPFLRAKVSPFESRYTLAIGAVGQAFGTRRI
jgi:hypothetical protein